MYKDHSRNDLNIIFSGVTAQESSISNSEINEGNRGLDGPLNTQLYISEMDDVTDVEIKTESFLRGPLGRDYGIYHITVKNSNRPAGYRKWTVFRRFLHFAEFDAELREELNECNSVFISRVPHLPHKHSKFLIDHTDQTFIEKRRVLLQVYLKWLIRYSFFRRHPLLQKFLDVGTNSECLTTKG